MDLINLRTFNEDPYGTQKSNFGRNVELSKILRDLSLKDTQVEAAKKLQQYLAQYQEDSDDNLFNKFVSMLQSSNKDQIIGAMLAINKVVRIGRETRIVHNVKKIINPVFKQLHSQNQEIVEIAATCMGVLAQAGGKNIAETIDKVPQLVIKMLKDDQDPKSKSMGKYAAVLVLKEFFQKLSIVTFQKLFDTEKNISIIFEAMKDHRIHVRQTAADIINESISLINKREYNQILKKKYTTEIFNKVFQGLENTDLAYQQSALQIMAELIQIRSSSKEENVIYKNQKLIIDQILRLIHDNKSVLVKRQCVQLLPNLVKCLPEFQTNDAVFQKAMTSIFTFMLKAEKDKKEGTQSKDCAYVSLGKISLIAQKNQFYPHLSKILDMIDLEIGKPIGFSIEYYCRPLPVTGVLLCIRDLTKFYGKELIKKFSIPPKGFKDESKVPDIPTGSQVIQGLGSIHVYNKIASLFYFGFKKPLIDCLKELCNVEGGQYRMGIQAKLLNTIYIILTQHIDYYPMAEMIENAKKNYQEHERAKMRREKKKPTAPSQQISESPPSFKKVPSSEPQSPAKEQVMDSNQLMFPQQKKEETKVIDPNSLYNPSYIDMKRIDNLKALLSLETQFFLKNSVDEIDKKILKKFKQDEIASIKQEQIDMIILAFRALCTFGLGEIEKNFDVLKFMSESVLPFLNNENTQIRNEAVQTFSFLQFNDKQRLTPRYDMQVNKLLHKFFMTAMTDPDINIRVQMLTKINANFDPFIARYESLLMLFNCMKDSNNEIKIKTIKILGRLSIINPQQILPYLRNLIVQLISLLEHSQQYKEREEAAKLIKAFVKYNRDLSKSYIESILNCLFLRIDQDKKQKITTPFISALLEVMREISFVDSDSVKPYIGQIFPLILDSVKDQSDFQKREVALNTLIAMIENTGFVVKPYFFYPELLSIIRNLVQSEPEPAIKELVLKLIGTLGAVDPYLINQIKFYHKQKNANDDDEMLQNIPQMLGIDSDMIMQGEDDNNFQDIENLADYVKDVSLSDVGEQFINFDDDGYGIKKQEKKKIVLDINRPLSDEYAVDLGFENTSIENTLKKYNIKRPEITKSNKYRVIAMEALIKILNDQTLVDHHKTVLNSLSQLIKGIGTDCIQFFPLIIPSILNCISIEGNGESYNYYQDFYRCLTIIIEKVPSAIKEYQSMIFDSIEKVIILKQAQTDNSILIQVIMLLKHINQFADNNYLPQMNFILPKILQLLDQKKREVISDIAQGVAMSQDNQKQQAQQQEKALKLSKEVLQMINELNDLTKDDNLHLIIPLMVRVIARSNFNAPSVEITFKVEICNTFKKLIKCKGFREYIANIVHTLINVLEVYSQYSDKTLDFNRLYQPFMELINEMASHLKIDFAPFIPMIQATMDKLKRPTNANTIFLKEVEDIQKLDVIDLFRKNLVESQQQEIRDEEMLNQFQIVGQENNASIAQNWTDNLNKIDFDLLVREFDTERLALEADWNDWLKKTSYQLLKQSPDPILQACSTVAEVYSPLAQELYNVAFLTLWRILNDLHKDKIMRCIQNCIHIKHKPRAVLQTILNLHEFMELDDKDDAQVSRIFDEHNLAEVAEECNAYAKALYYWEVEFQNDAKSTIEKIITTNYVMGQPDAAKGILDSAMQNQMIEKDEEHLFDTPEWLEKRHEWNQALDQYSQLLSDKPSDKASQRGKLRCLKNISDWKNLSVHVKLIWEQEMALQERPGAHGQSQHFLDELAFDGLESSWYLGEWADFQRYMLVLKKLRSPPSFEQSFYSAIIEIKQRHFKDAQRHIDKARQLLDPQITSLLGESYNRAYSIIQDLQSLKELEEVIAYFKTSSELKKKHIYKLWQDRLAVQPTDDLKVFQRSLKIRSIVIDAFEEIDAYIKFAHLARLSGNHALSSNITNQLLQDLNTKLSNSQDQYHGDAQQKLRDDCAKVKLSIYEDDFNQPQLNLQVRAIEQLELMLSKSDEIKDPHILSDANLKLAKWSFEYKEQLDKAPRLLAKRVFLGDELKVPTEQISGADYDKSIRHCQKATEYVKTSSEAWHFYSQINYDASKYYEYQFALTFQDEDKQVKNFIIPEDYGDKIVNLTKNNNSKINQQQRKLGMKYITSIICSIQGLTRQLQLADQSSSNESSQTLQNTLRLMKIWFKHGGNPEIDEIVRDGIKKINLRVWINATPQLLARIDIKQQKIKLLLIDLLERLSQRYPQALVYSLSVGKKSNNQERMVAADALISKLKLTQGALIEQANLVSEELIRAAILLPEMWNEAIEEASRAFFNNKDPESMIASLTEMHEVMEKAPETMNEINFYQGFASDLEEAKMWTDLYEQTKSDADLNQAWDIYLGVFRRISDKFSMIQYYELRNVAPKLMALENLKIAVPGTFRCDRKIVRIAKFSQVLPVFPSKQHPRKLTLYGDDGREYYFLLKGHEDTRQDERVMQFFGLVNSLLQTDPRTCKKDLMIKRYSVTPLSQMAGLIGMVPNVDTLHGLIKEHRQPYVQNTETNTMESFFENYENCPLLKKVEIFRFAQNNTKGEDLQRVLWLKSQNSEVWLERRTNYTRSLAVMSMVGYILGLGDRHPSNILLERTSGKIVHIDFGDCFESAMRREKYPEKIPFRLTRMLQKAMEVSGIEGTFRNTCEQTMQVMRANKDSLLAILEAFVHDPLLSFRLLNLQALITQKNQESNMFVEAPKLNHMQASVKGTISAKGILDAIANRAQNEIRQSIVEATITRYQLGQVDAAAKSYAYMSIQKKNDAIDLQKMVQEKEDDEKYKNELDQAAEAILMRIKDKLKGTEFPPRWKSGVRQKQHSYFKKEMQNQSVMIGHRDHEGEQKSKLPIEDQVDLLIQQATSHENLAQCYKGWCPYW